MGHDIDVIDPETGERPASLYHTMNWKNFGIDKVGLPYMAHGHSGRVIARKLLEMLEDFANDSATDNWVDNWGMDKNTGMKCQQDWKLRGRFKLILLAWLRVAAEYPNHIWYSDQVWGVEPLYDELGTKLEDLKEKLGEQWDSDL